ncbi:DUF2460 domain-containing protein [Aquibaculum arenosum]|uniref:DUF2460 domain-containing protein n=1 Tax=Aquibaculum arenosum TaxID=3032591 RepID=A0ABT5YQR8_9PROT|nr:DUF2460 domain-containing protein [Fodinicurvata sp. CAU 1616]MDF2097318.1 DUF2460 domain-containing protein [Fodinicurvata sp. CAU 1616]
MSSFDDVAFPHPLSRRSAGGPEFRTAIVETASGREYRNQEWAAARLRFDAARGLRSVAERDALLAFFYARRGRARSFPLRDFSDHSSAPSGPGGGTGTPDPGDQSLGEGDGQTTAFQLLKWYGEGAGAYARTILLPVTASVRVALDGVEQASGWSVSRPGGVVTFETPPANGVLVSAGFLFEVPVRFDADRIEMQWISPAAQELGEVPLVEVRDL